jgi:TolB protein
MVTRNNKYNPYIGILLDEQTFQLTPGQATVIPVRITNPAEVEDFFEVEISGIPRDWLQEMDRTFKIEAGGEEDFLLTIEPSPNASGAFPLKITAFAQRAPQNYLEEEILLRIAAFQSAGRIGIAMDSTQFSISPETTVTVPIKLANNGLAADDFQMDIKGIPVSWVSTPTPEVHLAPGQSKKVILYIKPPRDPETRAGRHPFAIQISSRMDPKDRVAVDCVLSVATFTNFECGISPAKIQAGDHARLTIENKGNIDQTFHVQWESLDNDLEFAVARPESKGGGSSKTTLYQGASKPFSVRVQGGRALALGYRAYPIRRTIFGSEKSHSYVVEVQPASKPDSDRKSLSGQVLSQAWFPRWVLPVLVVVLVSLACLSIFLVGQGLTRPARETQIAANLTEVIFGGTETAVAHMTQAAVLGEEDSDGDGLTNTEEETLQTDPMNPDSDGDEISDGDEVLLYGTNPLLADSDEDGLSDGDEILRRSTNPLNADSDSDSIIDGTEIELGTDPLNQDSDQDELLDGDEVLLGTDPTNPDTDSDGLLDGMESNPCPDPLNPDSDADGFVDGRDFNPCNPDNPALTATAEFLLNETEAAITPTPETPTLEVTITSEPELITLPGSIAYMSDREGNQEIFNKNGSDWVVTRLTDNSALDIQPSWSKDGSKLAFTSLRDNNSEIYVMNADGSGLTNLTNSDSDDQTPAWSPDGEWIAFASNREDNWEIFIMRSDGSQVQNISNSLADDTHPAWFSEGQIFPTEYIVFVSNRDDNSEIYLMTAQGEDQTNLTNHPANDNFPSAPWDGGHIAFISDRPGVRDLFLMTSNGGSIENLTNDPNEDLFPSWSPDGNWIAFTKDVNNREIYVINLNDRTLFNFTNDEADDSYPSWR